VRCLQPEHFGMLGLPVAELLALLHGRGGLLPRRPSSSITATAISLKYLKLHGTAAGPTGAHPARGEHVVVGLWRLITTERYEQSLIRVSSAVG